MNDNYTENDYVVIKAVGGSVQVIGLTRGDSTTPHHTENIGDGEVMILQFTEKTSAIKVRGKAEIYTKHGMVVSGK